MSPEELRRKAEVCLRFAERAEDQEIAARLKIMAGEYLIQADMLGERLFQAGIVEESATSVENAPLYVGAQREEAGAEPGE